MANPYPALKYQVQEAIYDSKSMLDEDNFYHQRMGSPAELTRKITWILGDYTKNYPISLMTLGGTGLGGDALNNAAIELDDVQFTYPVMGRMNKACLCSSTPYSSADSIGIGNSKFKLRFPDNWFKRFFIIQSSRGIQAYIHGDPDPLPTGEVEYTVSLDPASATDTCPLSEVSSGAAWAAITTAVPESRSRTTESKMVVPGKYKNQMTFMRHGFSWAGNAANKMMRIDVTKPATDSAPALTSNVWMDFAMWQYEIEWLSIREHNYWYSRYNRQTNGEILLKDDKTGKPIPRGAGILEQIQNTSTYASLTYNYLSNQIGDALFGQSDTSGITITLHTGLGGKREFHKAIMAAGATVLGGFIGTVAEKFVTGSGYNLALGGYYDTFYHIDGYIVKVKHNPIFDMGNVAMAQQAGGYVHPETGWPLESYRMVFIDDNDYDGMPNIQHVHEKGRPYLHAIIPGLTPMPRSLQIAGSNLSYTDKGSAGFAVTDVDESAYTRLASCGIQIRRANRCFDFQCIAGL